MICPECGEVLEESDFDSKIAICPECNVTYADKEYDKILKSMK